MNINWQSKNSDSVQLCSRKLGLIGTGFIWIVLMIFFAVSPFFHKKEHYKTVRITLESTPVESSVKKTDAAAPAAKAEALKPASAEAAPVPVSKPAAPSSSAAPSRPSGKAVPAAETAPAVTERKKIPAAKETITYKKSIDELIAEQTSSSPKEVHWDDSMFDDAAESVSSAPSAQVQSRRIAGSTAFSGTAAAAAESSVQPVSGTGKSSDAAGASPSASTKSALDKINSATYMYSVSGGISSEASMNTVQNAEGKVAVEMADGSSRILLDPAEPVIIISEENALLIDSSRTVTVVFKVLSGGNVPLSGIVITPSSALPLPVQSEIRSQISEWRFVPASSDGQARFMYSIIRK